MFTIYRLTDCRLYGDVSEIHKMQINKFHLYGSSKSKSGRQVSKIFMLHASGGHKKLLTKVHLELFVTCECESRTVKQHYNIELLFSLWHLK